MGEKRLAYYRWEDPDPFRKEQWTAWTVSVYAPSYDRPYVSVLLSVANGGGKCLTRYASLEAARGRVNIPKDGVERLELALTRAIEIERQVKADLRLLDHSHSLPEGGQIVRTDTGQVIAEAERILKGKAING